MMLFHLKDESELRAAEEDAALRDQYRVSFADFTQPALQRKLRQLSAELTRLRRIPTNSARAVHESEIMHSVLSGLLRESMGGEDFSKQERPDRIKDASFTAARALLPSWVPGSLGRRGK